MRILIVEDDVTSRMMLRSVLAKWGYDVLEAVDGETAWEILSGPDAPKLVILDWIMPGIDGLELVQRVRSRSSVSESTGTDTTGLPYIMMLTSKDRKDDVIACLDAGADDYLTKPFDPGELKARVGVGRRMVEMRDGLALKVKELKEALNHIHTLQGILPICSFCKKIRDDTGYWNQVEAYISLHSEIQFSHGVCPECMKKHYPEFYRDDK